MNSIQSEIEKLEHAISSLEQQRETLGDLAVNTAIAGLRQKLDQLNAQSEPEQRKLLTILFADISALSSHTERLRSDPDGASTLEVWQTLGEIVQKYEGKVIQRAGQAVMALWGLTGVREEDADHAIRAAVEIQHSFLQQQSENPHLSGLQMRVGINSGMTHVTQSNPSQPELHVSGDAVVVANRLQISAPIGGILISHETYRQVRGLFNVLPVPPLSVAGHNEPVQAYLVQSPKPRSFRMSTRSVEWIETRMVGRESQFNLLKRLYAQSRDQSQARLACVLGGAGIGKSRMLHEFDLWFEVLPEPVYYFKGRCTPESLHQPYSLFHDLFRFRFQILESDTPAEVRHKLAAHTAPHLTPEQAYLMGQLIGFEQEELPGWPLLKEDPEALSPKAERSLLDYLQGMSSVNGMMIFLEDIHWADSASLQLILRMLQDLAAKRVMMIASTQSPLFERVPNWGSDQKAFYLIPIHPLAREDAVALVQEILQKVEYLPDSLAQRIADTANGIPLFIEELIKSLVEQGVIVRGSEKWSIRQERITGLHMPESLTELLQTRLDNLPYEEKKVLQRAAVIGRLFWDQAVAAMHTEGGAEPNIPHSLQSLQQRELLFHRDQSRFVQAQEYIFKHIILCDVTYETILPKMRSAYHHLAAEWYQQQAGVRLGEYISIIAAHYLRAGKTATAVEWLIQAGESAAQKHVFREAIAHFEQALQFLPPANRVQKNRLMTRLGTCWLCEADPENANLILLQALELAREINDQLGAAQALCSLGLLATRQGRSDEALERLTQSLKLARMLNDDGLIAEGLRNLAETWFSQLNYDAAANYYQQSLSICQRLNQPHGVNACQAGLNRVKQARGEAPKV